MQFISKFTVIRGFLTPPPLFYKDPLYCLPHLFSKYCQLPNPCKPQYPLALFATFFLWLNGWSRHIWCVILLNDNMNLQMLSLDTLVLQEPCGAFYPTWYLFTWSNTWPGFHLILWFDIIYTDEDAQKTQGLIDWHTHTNIY